MANGPIRQRDGADQDDSDEWLIAAARSAGHQLPQRARSRGTTAWRELLNAGLTDAEVLRLACATSGAQPADLTHLSPELGQLLPQRVALEHKVAPIGVYKGTLVVATSNPMNHELERELAFAAKQRVRLDAANPSDILRAQSIVYAAVYGTRADPGALFPSGTSAPARPLERPMLTTTEHPVATATPSGTQQAAARPTPAPAPSIVDRLLGAAAAERASEAILEPGTDGGFLVRLRIDGTRHDRFKIAATHRATLVDTLRSRAKMTADINGRGVIPFETPDGPVVARVTFEPAGNAQERVVLRLRWTISPPKLNDIGLGVTEQHRIKQILAARRGLLVVTGTPASGKTTTLYAAARELAEDGRNVTTIEAPIEQPLDHVKQIQIDTPPAQTLDATLRAKDSAEGDVVVIGVPLNALALQQSTTKDAPARLTIATLDAPDFLATLARLRELQPDGASLAAALQGIIVQRLVRRVCPSCAQSQVVNELPDQQQRLLYGHPTAKVRRPVGCQACRSTGYAGRIAIAEVVPIDAQLRMAIQYGATPAETAQLCRDAGISTLWDVGMQRVLDGTTSLAELLDTVPPPDTAGAAPQEDIDALLAQLLGTPRAAAPAEATVVAAPALTQPQASTPTAAAPAAVSTAPLRVLLVDDDAPARRELAAALTRAGLTVMQAADGVSGLEFATRMRPSVVVADVALPRMDVVAMLTALRAANDHVPVVVVTAQSDDKLTTWLRESGACDVLSRDLAVDVLVARLRTLARTPQP